MSNAAIRVEHIGKQFQIGGPQEAYRTLRDTITDLFAAPFRRLKNMGRSKQTQTIWALEDISFEVKQGEVVGVIGRNGAGKSTLLKVLSRIVEPTRGRAIITGRVGSLLEVGTGFHPELTGHENIFLNGAILGMTRAEIVRKLDEIIAFAEVEKFIHTPVKHYSSGMYLRLAFAVAAHLEPEVLLVDEVLAVGDARFQKKCLDRMREVGNEGRTVLFVSHNMPAVTHLCPRTILLDQGKVLQDGPSYAVVSTYLNTGLGTTASRRWDDPARRPGNEVVRLHEVQVLGADGQVTSGIDIRTAFSVEMAFEVSTPGLTITPHFKFFNDEGVCLFTSFDLDPTWWNKPRPAGFYRARCQIPGNLLAEGNVVASMALATTKPLRIHVDEKDVVAFQVIDSLAGDTARGDHSGRMPGVVRPHLPWKTQFTPESPLQRAAAD